MNRELRLLVALAMIALVGAGCGSNAPSETGTASSSGTASSGADKKLTARDKAVKFAECIRAHGVSDFPDPNAKNQFEYGVSVTPAVWKRATTACKDLQPPGFTGHKRSTQEQEGALAFARCIRENGVKDFPDPTPDAPLVDTNRIPSRAQSRDLSVLNAAMKTCSDLAPGVTGGR